MEFTIEFYKTATGRNPVEEVLLDLYKKDRALSAQTIKGIEKLRQKIFHGEPLTKHVEGGLYELRIKSGNSIVRVLFSFLEGRKIILLHGFIKKKQKTPIKELEIARARLKEIKEKNEYEKKR